MSPLRTCVVGFIRIVKVLGVILCGSQSVFEGALDIYAVL
jgi:hypothetical protein